MFYESVLQNFINFNKFLQREDPLTPVNSKQMSSFLTKLAGKFLPVDKIKETNGEFHRIQYKKEDKLSGMHIVQMSTVTDGFMHALTLQMNLSLLEYQLE